MSPGHFNTGKVLIIDDDLSIRRALLGALGNLGFDASAASNGEAGLEAARLGEYDAILLDMNMPGMGGLQTCREIRRTLPRAGILMLTVCDREEDKVGALDAGADDYVTKPFGVRELAARIRATVRRAHVSQAEPPSAIVVGDIELNADRREVRRNGESIHLTPKEFDLLRYLMAHAGLPITHARLLRAVWGPEYGGELEYLRTFVRQLRKKLEEDPGDPKYLLTDSHVGYRFREAAQTEPPRVGRI